jgi:hypothetical protein
MSYNLRCSQKIGYVLRFRIFKYIVETELLKVNRLKGGGIEPGDLT